jgi:hypothetical protein
MHGRRLDLSLLAANLRKEPEAGGQPDYVVDRKKQTVTEPAPSSLYSPPPASLYSPPTSLYTTPKEGLEQQTVLGRKVYFLDY